MAVVEIVVSAMFKEVLDKLVSEGVKQFMKLVNKGKNSKNEIKIEEWKVKLETIQAVLSDAERKQCYEENGDTIRLWLENLQDLAFDLEDLLDDFAYEALKMTQGSNDDFDVEHLKKTARRGFLPTSFHNMVGSVLACGCSSTRQIGYSGPDFSSRIDEISKAMNEIHSRFSTLGLSPNNLGLTTYAVERQQRNTPETSSLISEPHVYGRNDWKKDIICQLLEDKSTYKNYVVIPIVGMGGIGKTTLAQYVYNDEKVKGHFDRKAWVCVSDVFDVKRITIDIINSATTSGNFGCNNLNEAQQKLQEVVKDKKIFVVLDDVWCNVYVEWNQLQTPFLGAAQGSRVIVTTRNEDTARVMNNHFSYAIIHLERLSGEYCWSIFQQHVNTMYSDLAERRDDIIRKCDGLPLAAKTLGGLLRKTVEKSQRQRILDSNIWSKTCGILPVLRLSYHHLPSLLKCLFAYCSVFPKDYRYEEMEIIQLWMAQGFLPDNTNERMEDIGHGYFNDLVSRSLFEKSPSFEGMFIMHDLIHDVAQFAAGNLCNVMDGTDTQMDFRRTRHLFITEHVQTLGNEVMVPQLRTFLCNYVLKIDYSDFFKKIRYIRTLIIYSHVIEVLPECVGDLKHLCYLSLAFVRLKVLPQSISKLWNLQTLCLEGCYKLEKVPCIESLGKLRHLYSEYSSDFSLKEMPLGIGKLTNLQTLNNFVLAAGGGSRVRELGKLNHLRGSLSISSLENVIEIEDAQEAQLCKKESLDSLYLAWGTCTDEVDDKTMRDVVEKLKPHTSIKECELSGYMGLTFPNWLGDPSFIKMVDLMLKNCEKCEWLPPLGNLPSLKSLLIEDMNGIKEVGLEFYGHCSTPFPSLETLCFFRMKSWEKWVHPPVDNNKAFPILEELCITDCESLQGNLPPHLSSLRRLVTIQCRQLQSLELKNLSSSTSRLEIRVRQCESMVSIGHIPLTLQLLEIDRCKKLGYVEFDEQPPNLSAGSEESVGVSPKASLELPLLTELVIERCPSLLSLQQSLILPALQNLHLKDCENMERLPGELHNITSLQKLRIIKCPKISEAIPIIECIPCPHLSLPSSLSELDIMGFQNLKTYSLPPNLTRLFVLDCPRLESLVSNFNSLIELTIGNCPELHNFPEGGLPTNLRELSITGTNIDKPIKEWGLHLLTSLEYLALVNVGSCVDTVESIRDPDLPSSLCKLAIVGFQNLKTISNGNTLTRLSVRDCPRLESLISNFNSLISLSVENCPELHNFPEGGLPTNLRELSITGTNIDKPIKEWGLHLLTSLQYLSLVNIGSCVDTLESISYPDFPFYLPSLKIEGFQHLKTICCSTLPNLGHISISRCPKLESFGDNGRISTENGKFFAPNRFVDIKECDMIEQHLRSDPNGRISTENGKFSLPLSGSQPSSAHSST